MRGCITSNNNYIARLFKFVFIKGTTLPFYNITYTSYICNKRCFNDMCAKMLASVEKKCLQEL